MNEVVLTGRILLVDDEQAIRDSLGQALELAGFDVVALAAAEELPPVLAAGFDGVVLTDLRLPQADGLSVLAAVHAADARTPVVLMTGHGDVRTAVRAMRAGAFDFIEKPFRPEAVVNVLRHAVRIRAQSGPAGVGGTGPDPARPPGSGDAADGAEALGRTPGPLDRILGGSPQVGALRERIRRYAALNADVLVTGETGTGKELVARALHELGSRAQAPFVAINCGALAPELIGSELFGHEQGAFTGARARREGKFEFAHGGTVFLDEVESMPLAVQAELLRVLQERRFTRLGANREITVDVRVIAAAKVDLRSWAAEGRFREDLFYRLNVLRIQVPSLRERDGDLPRLFEAFVREAARMHALEPPPIGGALLTALRGREWPGNVRELQNAALRFVLDRDQDPSDPGGLVVDDATGSDDSGQPERRTASAGDAGEGTLADRVAGFEASVIQATLDRHGGELAATERELGISRRTLHEKIRRYGLIRRR